MQYALTTRAANRFCGHTLGRTSATACVHERRLVVRMRRTTNTPHNNIYRRLVALKYEIQHKHVHSTPDSRHLRTLRSGCCLVCGSPIEAIRFALQSFRVAPHCCSDDISHSDRPYAIDTRRAPHRVSDACCRIAVSFLCGARSSVSVRRTTLPYKRL